MAEGSPTVRLVAGLGNPGADYEFTRHNTGFLVVDRLARQWGTTWKNVRKWGAAVAKAGNVLLVKPMTYMNRSGEPLRAVAQFYKVEPGEILVVMDDMALPLGRIRIRLEGGPGGHNGLESIILQLGSDRIPRLRLGIGAAPPGGAVDWVLGRFFEEERPEVAAMVERAAEAAKWAIDKDVVSAMNTFNKSGEL